MSRTYRVRHLRQPEGGRAARRFVDARLRAPVNRAHELFLVRLAHVELKLPCKVHLPENYPVTGWGKTPLYVGWHHSHMRCLPPEWRDYLWTVRSGAPYYHLGFSRVMHLASHPLVGWGLAVVPSYVKRYGRNQAYRRARRASKRLLRLARWEEFDDPEIAPRTRFGLEIDADDDQSDFDARGIKRGLSASAWHVTW